MLKEIFIYIVIYIMGNMTIEKNNRTITKWIKAKDRNENNEDRRI